MSQQPWSGSSLVRRLCDTHFTDERGGKMADETKKAMPDHESDPARTPGDGWVGEGGASHLGPATNIASGREDAEASADEPGDTDADADVSADETD